MKNGEIHTRHFYLKIKRTVDTAKAAVGSGFASFNLDNGKKDGTDLHIPSFCINTHTHTHNYTYLYNNCLSGFRKETRIKNILILIYYLIRTNLRIRACWLHKQDMKTSQRKMWQTAGIEKIYNAS